MKITEKTEFALRNAMARLLAGVSLHTDGRLTISNLAVEAELSRVTVYRARHLIEAFRMGARSRLRQPHNTLEQRVALLEALVLFAPEHQNAERRNGHEFALEKWRALMDDGPEIGTQDGL